MRKITAFIFGLLLLAGTAHALVVGFSGPPSGGGSTTVFPTVDTVLTQGFSTSTNIHNVNMPATVDSGDLLIVGVAFIEASGGPSTPSGWTLLNQSYHGGLYAKVADGTEGGTSVDWNSTSTTTMATHLYQVSGWGGVLANDGDYSGTDSGTSSESTTNPPAVTAAWGVDKNLFIAISMTEDDDANHTAAPTNYTNLYSTISGGGANNGPAIGSARREYESASDDPGTFSIDLLEQWKAFTIVIEPGSSG